MISIFKRILNHPVNKDQKWRAIGRFLRWQLKSRINSKPVIITFVNDAKILVQRGFTDSTAQLYNGLSEFEEMGFLLHFLREEDLFLDVGANIGSYTILAAKVAKTKVMAFEPIPQTFEILNKNVSLNDISEKVRLYNMGIGAAKTSLFFSTTKDQQNHVVALGNKSNTLEVPVNSLDHVIKNENPTCLKIDVEGYETEVINGAKGMLKNEDLKVIVIELMGLGKRYGYNETLIHEYLLSLGFLPHEYDPENRLLTQAVNFRNKNIYIRDLDFVKDRISKAAPFKVFNKNI